MPTTFVENKNISVEATLSYKAKNNKENGAIWEDRAQIKLERVFSEQSK